MQIILIGAQSTGKTSVVKSLPQEYKQYCIREVIRNMTSQDPSVHINTGGDEVSQNRFFFEYLYLFSKYPDYISDRGLLDVCAYTLWLVRRGNVDRSVYEKQMYILKEWIRTHPDTIHVYFPICFPVVDDGYRDADEDNRTAVDECVRDVMDELIRDGLWRGYTIGDGTVADRVEELLNIIRTHDD